MNSLAIFYSEAGRLDDALELREEFLELYRKVRGPEHPETIGAMINLALFHEQAGRKDEAAKLRGELKALEAKKCPPEPDRDFPVVFSAVSRV